MIFKSDHECIIVWINVVQQVLFSILYLKIHALAWLGRCFVDCAHVVLNQNIKKSVHMAFIELHLITPVTVVFKLTKVPDATRCSSVHRLVLVAELVVDVPGRRHPFKCIFCCLCSQLIEE